LEAVANEDQFLQFIRDMRQARDLRNDDVTVLSMQPKNS
jgi:hypothetical protein